MVNYYAGYVLYLTKELLPKQSKMTLRFVTLPYLFIRAEVDHRHQVDKSKLQLQRLKKNWNLIIFVVLLHSSNSYFYLNLYLNRGESRSHHHHRSHHNSSANLIGNPSGSSTTKKPRLEIGVKTSNGSLKMPSVTTTNTVTESTMMDLNNSDHVVAVTQLREQMASLQKQLSKKDQELLEKDKRVRLLLQLFLLISNDNF